MPAALLELIPELGLGLILFAFVVSYGAGRGLLVMWQRTFGWMLLGIAGFLNWSVKVLGHSIGFDFGHVFRAANNGVVDALEAWIATSEEGMARTLRAMRAVALAGVRASEWLAKETAQTFDWLTTVHLPRWARAALLPLLWPFLLARLLKYVPHIARTVIVKPVKVIERTLPGKVVTIIRRAGAVAIPGALGIPLVWREIHGLTKRNLAIVRRLRRLEALLGVTGLAIAMANVLGLGANWRCLTRGNIGRTARKLCGLPSHVLDDLLGLLVDVVLVADICQVITLLTEGLSIIQGPIDTLVTVAEGALCHGDYNAPPAADVTLDLPPVSGLALSLA